ncbi:MAG: hypothetical protein ABSF98_24730 [Bryobacteraceae bacterium]|jgi:hypothetical protein
MWGKHISFRVRKGIGFVLFAGVGEVFVGAVVGALGGGVTLQEDERAGGLVDEGAASMASRPVFSSPASMRWTSAASRRRMRASRQRACAISSTRKRS